MSFPKVIPVSALLAVALASPAQQNKAASYVLAVNGKNSSFAYQPVGGYQALSKLFTDDSNPLLRSRYPGRPQYDDITIQLDWLHTQDIFAVVSSYMNDPQNAKRSTIAVTEITRDGATVGSSIFAECALTSITFPGCDISSNEQDYISLSFSPTSATRTTTTGIKPAANQRGKWTVSDFSLSVMTAAGPLDLKAVKVEPTTVTVFSGDLDGDGAPDRVRLDPSDLVFYVTGDQLPYLQKWMEESRAAVATGDTSAITRRTVLTYVIDDQIQPKVACDGWLASLDQVGPNLYRAKQVAKQRRYAEAYWLDVYR